MEIIPFEPGDWPAVRAIYAQGIAGGMATFETAVPDWETWDARHRVDCRFTARVEGKVAGWVALVPVSPRVVYAGVAEVSVYVDTAYHGRGIGTALLERLIEASEEAGIWTLQAGVFPDNTSSIRLHEELGFREVGRRERIGRLNGEGRDVLLLERRSRRVGGIGRRGP